MVNTNTYSGWWFHMLASSLDFSKHLLFRSRRHEVAGKWQLEEGGGGGKESIEAFGRTAPQGASPIARRPAFLAIHAIPSIRLELLITHARSILKARMTEYQAPLGDLEGESLISTVAAQ